MYAFILQKMNFVDAICATPKSPGKVLEFCRKSREIPGTLTEKLQKK